MAEFNPYVQITPTQTVVDPFNAMVPQRAAGVSRPAEDWGKILGNLAPVLTKHFARLEDDVREEQDLMARKILAEEESSAVAKKIHRAAIAGNIPEGYSPYLIKQLNIQLGRKTFRDYEAAADAALARFEDPDYTDSPADWLAKKRQQLMSTLPGLEANADFANTFDPLLEKHDSNWIRAAHLKRSDARKLKAGQGLGDDTAAAWRAWELRKVEGVPALKDFNNEIKKLWDEAHTAGVTDGYSIPEGTLAKSLWARTQSFVDTLIAEERFDDAEDVLEAFAVLDPRGMRPVGGTGLNTDSVAGEPVKVKDWTKTGSMAYDFRDEIHNLSAKIEDKQRESIRKGSVSVSNARTVGLTVGELLAKYPEFVGWLESDEGRIATDSEVNEKAAEIAQSTKFQTSIPLMAGDEPLEVSPLAFGLAAAHASGEANSVRNNKSLADTDARGDALNNDKANDLFGIAVSEFEQAENATASGNIDQLRELVDSFRTSTLAINKPGGGAGTVADTPAGKEAIKKMEEKLESVRDKRQMLADKADGRLFTGNASVLARQNRAVWRTARDLMGKTNPAYALDEGQQGAKKLPEHIQERLAAYEDKNRDKLRQAAERAMSKVTTSNAAAINEAIDKEVDEIDWENQPLVDMIEAQRRVAADKLQQMNKALNTEQQLTSDAGWAVEWLTDYSQKDVRAMLSEAKTANPDDGIAFANNIFTNDHMQELNDYDHFYRPLVAKIVAGGADGFSSVVLDERTGNLIQLESKERGDEIDWSQETASIIQKAVDQFSAVDNWRHNPSGRERWTVVGDLEGTKDKGTAPIFIDKTTGLRIEPHFLNPDFFGVLSVEQAKVIKTHAWYGEFSNKWKVAKEEKNYTKQEELIREFETTKSVGRAYSQLPLQYQGDPVEFMERQHTLYKNWSKNTQDGATYNIHDDINWTD